MARRSNLLQPSDKNDKVRLALTSATAGTTVIYEDRLST
ncbi:uncharacterized protein BCN122_II1816 [Burkholderia cenocepacia]|nr:uncharacterized protein BCN122_II1816 [Burkholderia cenocepacia]